MKTYIRIAYEGEPDFVVWKNVTLNQTEHLILTRKAIAAQLAQEDIQALAIEAQYWREFCIVTVTVGLR